LASWEITKWYGSPPPEEETEKKKTSKPVSWKAVEEWHPAEEPEPEGEWVAVEEWGGGEPTPLPPEPEPTPTPTPPPEPTGMTIVTDEPVTTAEEVTAAAEDVQRALSERQPGWYEPGGEHPHPTLEQWLAGTAPEQYYQVTFTGKGEAPEKVSIEDVMKHPELYKPTPEMAWYISQYKRYKKEFAEYEKTKRLYELYVKGEERKRAEATQELLKETFTAKEEDWFKKSTFLYNLLGLQKKTENVPNWAKIWETQTPTLLSETGTITPEYAASEHLKSLVELALPLWIQGKREKAVKIIRKGLLTPKQIEEKRQEVLRLVPYERVPVEFRETALVPVRVEPPSVGIFAKVEYMPATEAAIKTASEEVEARLNEYLLHGERAWYKVKEAIGDVPIIGGVVTGFVKAGESVIQPVAEFAGKHVSQPVETVGGLYQAPKGFEYLSTGEKPFWERPFEFGGEMLFWWGAFKIPTTVAKGAATAVKKTVGYTVERGVRGIETTSPSIRTEWEIFKTRARALKHGIKYAIEGYPVYEYTKTFPQYQGEWVGEFLPRRKGHIYQPKIPTTTVGKTITAGRGWWSSKIPSVTKKEYVEQFFGAARPLIRRETVITWYKKGGILQDILSTDFFKSQSLLRGQYIKAAEAGKYPTGFIPPKIGTVWPEAGGKYAIREIPKVGKYWRNLEWTDESLKFYSVTQYAPSGEYTVLPKELIKPQWGKTLAQRMTWEHSAWPLEVSSVKKAILRWEPTVPGEMLGGEGWGTSAPKYLSLRQKYLWTTRVLQEEIPATISEVSIPESLQKMFEITTSGKYAAKPMVETLEYRFGMGRLFAIEKTTGVSLPSGGGSGRSLQQIFRPFSSTSAGSSTAYLSAHPFANVGYAMARAGPFGPSLMFAVNEEVMYEPVVTERLFVRQLSKTQTEIQQRMKTITEITPTVAITILSKIAATTGTKTTTTTGTKTISGAATTAAVSAKQAVAATVKSMTKTKLKTKMATGIQTVQKSSLTTTPTSLGRSPPVVPWIPKFRKPIITHIRVKPKFIWRRIYRARPMGDVMRRFFGIKGWPRAWTGEVRAVRAKRPKAKAPPVLFAKPKRRKKPKIPFTKLKKRKRRRGVK